MTALNLDTPFVGSLPMTSATKTGSRSAFIGRFKGPAAIFAIDRIRHSDESISFQISCLVAISS